MDKLKELKKLVSNNWQKICVTEDWSKPDFKYVLDNVFVNNASYHRKQWEFVAIFLCLVKQGKLHDKSIGASFGAGKEPLIYHLLSFVKSFLATDLYSWATGWDTAKMGKTDTPIDFLHRNAPAGQNLDNLQAKEMDMRKLDIADDSLDFCYSSCAIEHIGHKGDFIQHLKEVKRVLKDDGIYVVTTEFLFNQKTIANKGNYKFDIEYMRDLFIEAGLDTQPVFDASCEESWINWPRAFVRPLVGGKNMEKLLSSAAILDIEGVVYTSCCFVLTPSKEKIAHSFEAQGQNQSSEFVERKKNNNIISLYTDERSLDPFYSLNKKNRLFLDDHMQFRVTDDNNRKIKLDKANFCFTDFICFNNKNISFTVNYKLSGYKGRANWFLVEKNALQIKGRKKLKTIHVFHKEGSVAQKVVFDFSARQNKVYAVIGQFAPKFFKKDNIEFSIDFLYVTARITPT